MKTQKPTMYDLAKHPFIQICLEDGLSADKAIGTKKIFKVKPDCPRIPTEYEYYILSVSSAATQLLNIFQDLEDSLLYLNLRSDSILLKRLGITKHRYIRYSFENFIIRSQSLHGRILFLIDAVFHLGTPDDHVTHRLIAGNIHVQMSPVINDLKGIKKTLEKYLFQRNEVIHHRSYDEDDLRILEVFTIHQEINPKYKIHVKELSSKLLSNKVIEYSEFMNVIFRAINVLFGNLQKEYDKRKNRLI
jgi:hypothetical protein